MRLAVVFVLSMPALAAPDLKVELGRRLFFDRTASRTGRVSCSSCHDPEHGFSDPRRYSEDEGGETVRHSMPVLDVADGRTLHWDGEFANVRELLVARLDPFGRGFGLFREIRKRHFEAAKAEGRGPDERSFEHTLACGSFDYATGPDRAVAAKRGHRPSPVSMSLRLGDDDRYREAFRVAFGSAEITTDRVIDAIEAYVLSLRSGESPFDRHVAGDAAALTAAQRRGLALFAGRAGCAACHTIDGARPRLTDGRFHNTGVAFRPVERDEDENVTLRDILLDVAGDGAGGVNFVAEDDGQFKTPSLRDVARRGPYMHDGSLATLEDVVRYYSGGGIRNPRLDDKVRALDLSDEDVNDLVAFLGALTCDERPGIGPALPMKDKMRVRVTDLRGKPIQGLSVEIRPAGDRLEGGLMDDPPETKVTNADGLIAFRFPCWTHVHLTSDTHEIHYDRLIPDCAPRMEVMAASRDEVALKLRMTGPVEHELVARWAGSDEILARFRFVRMIAKGVSVYVAPARPAGPRWATIPPRQI